MSPVARRFQRTRSTVAALCALGGVAYAEPYGFPTTPEDYGAFYVTAYRDDGGHDWNCLSGHYDGHTGTDFGCGSWRCMDEGRAAAAAAEGTVIAAHDGEFDRCTTADCGTGNYVKLRHSDGRETWYWHLKQWSVTVSVGDVVPCGAKLGEVGSSGNSLGPHLHFGAADTQGRHVDPFVGPCSGAPMAWLDQGVYDGLPALGCGATAAASEAAQAAAIHAPQSTDLDGDGAADALLPEATGWRAAGLGRAWDTPPALLAWRTPTEQAPLAWTRWRVGDWDGDGRADVCERGVDAVTCALAADGYATTVPGPPWSDADGLGADGYASTLRAGDLDGDGRDDLCIRTPDGVQCALAVPGGFGAPFDGPALSDALSWNAPDNYGTLRLGDIDGDGTADVCVRANVGMRCYRFAQGAFQGSWAGPAWGEDAGWLEATHWASITLADVDGDGRADLCGRTQEGWDCHLAVDGGFDAAHEGPRWSDATGWNDPTNAWTFRLGDVDGDGDLDVCARANAGIRCAWWDGTAHSPRFDGPAWSDEAGWGTLARARSIRLADVTGDGRADLCGVDAAGPVCHPSVGTGFGDPFRPPESGELDGWLLAGPACADRDGDGRADCRPTDEPAPAEDTPPTDTASPAPPTSDPTPMPVGGGCGCASAASPLSAWGGVMVLAWRRRGRRRHRG
jgi:murein DD-endopeptidase MepM/ murein hydrolase activator NlpD